MADEPNVAPTEPQPEGGSVEGQVIQVGDERWIAALAEKLVTPLAEAHLQKLGPELAQKLAQYQGQVQGRKAAGVAATAQEMIQGRSRSNRAQLDDEQKHEALRVMLLRLNGLPAEPDESLDVNDIITQAIGPASGSGAYNVPDDFNADIETRAATPAIIWPLVRKYPTSREAVTQPVIADASHPASSVGSSANSSSVTTSDDVTETTITETEKTWTMRYFDARLVVKLDLLDDAPGNVYEQLVEAVADDFVENREYYPLLGAGSGSSEPVGLIDSGSGITEVAIDAAPSVANVLDLCAELPQRYRVGGRATVLSGSDTHYAVVAALAQNVRAPQFLIDALPRLAENSYVTEGKMLAGAFEKYVVYYNRLMRMVTSVRAQKFSMEIVFVEKWDGQIVNTNAFRIGTGVTYG